MNGDFSELLQGVLQDPDAMQKLMGVAKSFLSETPDSKSASEAVPPEVPPPEKQEPSRALQRMTAGNSERIALIAAVRPYLSPARRQTADGLIKMLKMLKLADLNKLFNE